MTKRSYWLFKTEPDVFSWDDLLAAEQRTSCWEGVRNYQARNLLRDEMKVGDGVLFYHSRIDPQVIPGTATIVRAGYPDPFQFDRRSKYHDPKADPDDPRWYAVDVKADREFVNPWSLPELKQIPALADMMLLRRGARLSVQPVSAAHWKLLTTKRKLIKV